MLNEVLKMISADVKANVKEQELKDLAVVSLIFFKKYLGNLKYNVKRAYIFHLILVNIPSSEILLTDGPLYHEDKTFTGGKSESNVFKVFKITTVFFLLRFVCLFIEQTN